MNLTKVLFPPRGDALHLTAEFGKRSLRFATIVLAGANVDPESIVYGRCTGQMKKDNSFRLLGAELPGKV